MRPLRVTLAFFLASAVAIANADSIEFGATALCAGQPPEFELAAIVQHNEDTTSLSAHASAAKQLKYGTHKLRCSVAGRAVSMTVHVNPPMNGHCVGAGYVAITSFRVGSHRVPLDLPAQSFNYKCLEDPMLVRFSVKRAGSRVVVERCSSDDWTWDDGYSKLACTEQVIL